jgi:hypothetical protein
MIEYPVVLTSMIIIHFNHRTVRQGEPRLNLSTEICLFLTPQKYAKYETLRCEPEATKSAD